MLVARDPQPDPRSTSQRAERVPSCPQLPPAAASAPQVKLTVLPVEIPLVTEELEDIDRRLSTAEQTLFWHHEGKSPPGQDPGVPADGSRAPQGTALSCLAPGPSRAFHHLCT